MTTCLLPGTRATPGDSGENARNGGARIGRISDPRSAESRFIFSVVVDKRHLHDYMTQEKLHRKAWELLLERVEYFMWTEHDRHQAVMVVDDAGPQLNRSLAMKHAYFQDQGTSAGQRLRHIVEMPLFVRSELSNGVQLADMVSYTPLRIM